MGGGVKAMKSYCLSIKESNLGIGFNKESNLGIGWFSISILSISLLL
jgi:hypothetical protein